ncbi:MAG TPA: ABC transporter ATP-binding protein [Acidimicrobiales bacterium]|nr:ABC transporter ATP-binding protein [Acidimicrobiales bacterium]
MSAVVTTALGVRVDGRDLVRGVDLVVEPGTWCTVVGPNGAGKTTLVRAIAGLRRASVGRVELSGRDVATLGERDRARRVSLVVQHPEVPDGMSVREYVGLGRTAHHGLLRGGGPRDEMVVSEVLERLGLVGLAARDVATLSGGERQRTVLARALAQSTPVMVLDEPTTGLDLRHQVELLELLRAEVAAGLTVVATLHDLTLAGQFADRLVLLDEGVVATEGPPRDVVRSAALAAAYQMELRVVDVDGVDVVVPARASRSGASEPAS